MLPARWLPVLYLACAHLCLLLACAAVALDPRGAAGFFYHARMVAIVHLVTLGWIGSSILGAIYIVAPMALRTAMPARTLDYAAFALAVAGTIGMASHFWIAEYSGMAWSAAMVMVGVLYVMARVSAGLRPAPIPGAVKLHVWLASANVAGAATMGVLLASDKVYHFLPGYVLANVYAHAHLAAVGWAAMMVVGIGYRMLPMVLPAAMPKGPTVYASAVLLEIGVVGLFVSLVAQSIWTPAFGIITLAGFASFLLHVAWMVRRPRPAPPALSRPDYGARHAKLAMGYLAVTAVIGLALAFSQPSEWTLRVAVLYGVCGLVGFLAQMVVGMEARILPMATWYWAFANTGYQGPVPSPHAMPDRSLQRLTFYGWAAGVPLLAGGLFAGASPFVAAGAWMLLAAMALAAFNTTRVVMHGFRPRPDAGDDAPAVGNPAAAEPAEPGLPARGRTIAARAARRH